jgi:hypothetical protein
MDGGVPGLPFLDCDLEQLEHALAIVAYGEN